MTTGDVYGLHREAIAGILDERLYPLWWVDQEVVAGRIVIVGDERAVIGLQRREYPGGAVELHGMFVAGDLPVAFQFWDAACAAAAGFDLVAVESRPAWERMLKGRGFRLDRVRLIKELR